MEAIQVRTVNVEPLDMSSRYITGFISSDMTYDDELETVSVVATNKYNSTGFVGPLLDVAFICITTGVSLYSMAAIKKLIRANRKKMVKRIEEELYKYIGSAVATAASAAIDIALTITGTSIGGLLAEALDRVDKVNDNYIFA